MYRSLHWLAFSCLLLVLGSTALGCTEEPPLLTLDAGTQIDANVQTDAGSPCENGIRDGDESHVDCGGSCAPCGPNSNCIEDSDCQSGVCERNYCLVRSCTDGVRNGPEVGVDCGGDCGLCPDGQTCASSTECQSGHCRSSMCVPAQCDDGRINGHESDTDCGGPECAPCGAGLACNADDDCNTLLCADGACAFASCGDRIQNQDETSVDCGGAVCGPCDDGLACEYDIDCANLRCVDGGCVSCNDNVQNADETDVDCGGSVCEPCDDLSMCVVNGDCVSDHCLDGTCVSCQDELQNQDETDLDCGGPFCGGCADGLVCLVHDDCESGNCTEGVCISCNDGLQNQDETDVDCGGATCGTCALGATCVVSADCASGMCTDGVCVPPCSPDVGTTVTRLSTTGISTLYDYYLVADANPSGYVYVGGYSHLYRVPKAGGAVDDVESLAGIGTGELGYEMVIAGDEIFTIEDNTSGTDERVIRISTDGGATWINGGEDYAIFPGEPEDDFRGATVHGGTMYLITEETTTSDDTEIWSLSVGATTLPVTATLVGTIPQFDCSGLAADSTYFYTMCEDDDAIVRIDRATLTTTLIPANTSLSATRNAVALEDTDGDGVGDVLYYQVATEDVFFGCLNASFTALRGSWGTDTGNYGMASDPAGGTLYAWDDDTDELIVIQ